MTLKSGKLQKVDCKVKEKNMDTNMYSSEAYVTTAADGFTAPFQTHIHTTRLNSHDLYRHLANDILP